ncbi:MAG: HAD family hydrolase [Longimicrobiales bacterium]
MRRHRAIFLDAGGTLIHLDRAFILNALADVGVNKDEAAFLIADQAARERRSAAIRGGEVLDDASSWRIYASHLLALLEAAGEAAESVYARVRARHRAGTLWTHVEPGTAETLAELKARGYKLGVVSNADGRVASFLELVGLGRWLDFVVDSGAVGVEKPHPGIFEIALRQAGVQPAEAVHVGDVYEVDVLGARAAGIEAILLVASGGPAPAGVRTIRAFSELALQVD